MKTIHFTILCLVAFFITSCNDKSSTTYHPLDGYKGKVKKLTIYEYNNEFEKNRTISTYGSTIPKSIFEYNEFGLLTTSTTIKQPNETSSVFKIKVDSIIYNDDLKPIKSTEYEILIHPKDASLIVCYNEPQKLIAASETFTSKRVSDFIYEYNNNTHIEIETQKLIRNWDKLYNLPTQVQQTFKKNIIDYVIISDEYDSDDYCIIDEGNNIIFDTITTIYQYENDRMTHKTKIGCDWKNEVINTYENDLLISTAEITNTDTIYTNYTYKNGILWEKDEPYCTYRYDESGRNIYFYSKLGSSETISTYKDSTEFSITTSNKIGNSVSLAINNKDNLELYYITIELNDNKTYLDDAVNFLERFRDNHISKTELENGINNLVRNIDDSNLNRIVSTTYTKYDKFDNPVNIVKNTTHISNKRALFLSSSILKYIERGTSIDTSKQIVEKEIEYYE